MRDGMFTFPVTPLIRVLQGFAARSVNVTAPGATGDYSTPRTYRPHRHVIPGSIKVDLHLKRDATIVGSPHVCSYPRHAHAPTRKAAPVLRLKRDPKRDAAVTLGGGIAELSRRTKR